jgi:pimeloyl-ACP methyl ester carboxylesterase
VSTTVGGHQSTLTTLTPFPYDWRRDIRDTARLLHDRLAMPDLKDKRIGIVAHSMGGLIARYALERLPKSTNVELLVLAAVPNHGAPVAFQNLIGARPEVFLTGAQCKKAVNNPAFPAAYQLLPHPATRSFFNAAGSGMNFADIYDPNVYLPLGLAGASMEIAKSTWNELLTLQLGVSTPVPYFVVAGNAGTTVIAVYLPEGGKGSVVIDTTVAGDSTVPIWSAAPASLPCRFVPCDHLGVFEDGQMHRILQGLLKPSAANQPFFMAFNATAPLHFVTPDLNVIVPNHSLARRQPHPASMSAGIARQHCNEGLTGLDKPP